MARHLYREFPAEEQQAVAVACRQVGLAPQDFEIIDEVNDISASPSGGAARQVTVRRMATGSQSVYEDGESSPWIEEFESDLECGLFGRVSA
ncbi:hypothetical protein CupriaWKF_33180 [Cupriavidus sp. WKF15]|uniref:hypothetical protein n=1 Tax=Cupriavidus sp. WKF15 TaxID=3032282 RepID=UPI0023E2FCF2|nr:hypothetical protein [Cupriavidus sp. WKF15]WER50421.1 hypothetical protein CupriaWKF_33180 [Cupriavidus sp. WKF15]